VYRTDHLKTEGEIAWTGTAVTFGFQPIDVPGAPGSGVPVERSYRTFKMSAPQLYQFRRNQLFHPFVGGGIDVDREVRRFERREQRIQLYGPGGRLDAVITVPPEFEPTTD